MKIQRIAFLSAALALATVAGRADAFDAHRIIRHMGLGWGDGYHSQPCCNAYQKGCRAQRRHVPYHGAAVQPAPVWMAPNSQGIVDAGPAYPSPMMLQGTGVQRRQSPDPMVQGPMINRPVPQQFIEPIQPPSPRVQSPQIQSPPMTQPHPLQPPMTQPHPLQPPMNQPEAEQQGRFQQRPAMPVVIHGQSGQGPLVYQTAPRPTERSIIIHEPQRERMTAMPTTRPGYTSPLNFNVPPRVKSNTGFWSQWQPAGR